MGKRLLIVLLIAFVLTEGVYYVGLWVSPIFHIAYSAIKPFPFVGLWALGMLWLGVIIGVLLTLTLILVSIISWIMGK